MSDSPPTTAAAAATAGNPAAVRSSATRVGARWQRWGLTALVGLALALPFALNAWKHRQRAEFKSQCLAAKAKKEWHSLLDLSRAWRQWDPRDDDALLFTAQAAVELDQLEVAVDALGRVADNYHGVLQALAYRAEIQQAGLNRIYDAEATWRRMLDIDPRATLPRQRLIYFYAMTLQRRKLVEQIESAMQLACEPPESYTYLLMRDSLNFSDGLAQTTRWLAAYPDDEILAAAQAVYAAKQTSQRRVATFGAQTVAPGDLTLVDRCLERFPSNLEALTVKLDHAIFEGDKDRVLKLLQQAGADAEMDSRFWRARGWLMSATGRPDDADQSLRRALELNPFDWQARWLLADVCRTRGQTTEADQLAELALQGKELQMKIFERPNARDIDEVLIGEMHAYIQRTGASAVLDALENRL